jgi:hypothetical protein
MYYLTVLAKLPDTIDFEYVVWWSGANKFAPTVWRKSGVQPQIEIYVAREVGILFVV